MDIKIQPPKQLSKELHDEYFEVEKTFVKALQIGDPSIIDESYNKWEKLHAKILAAQVIGTRYHKGGEFHNMRMCKYYTLQSTDAFRLFLLAYFEDLLSVNIKEANAAPAATNIKILGNVTDKEFEKIQEYVANEVKTTGTVQNPESVLQKISELRIYEAILKRVKKKSQLITPNKYTSISHLLGEWEKRVFIGGDYESLYSLDSIIVSVSEFGFIPIIAMEFKTPEDRIHHDALLLLHNCKYAIFDVSSKGGHMMEAERTLDYGTETLFVCNRSEETRVSEMLKSLGKQYELHWYKDRKELKNHILNLLKPEGILIFNTHMGLPETSGD